MNKIPDNYVCIDDLKEELDWYMENLLTVHFKILELYNNVGRLHNKYIDKHRLQKPLREFRISNKELEDKVQGALGRWKKEIDRRENSLSNQTDNSSNQSTPHH